MRPTCPLIETEESTATVLTAAGGLGVEPGRIAKTLAVRVNERVFLLVARGDARLDNAKTKAAFGGRPRMLGPEETFAVTGHPVGGVCPFGLARPLPIHLRHQPSALRHGVPRGRLAQQLGRGRAASASRTLIGADWVDLCRLPEER